MNLVVIINQVNKWLGDKKLTDDEAKFLIRSEAKKINLNRLQLEEIAWTLVETNFGEADVQYEIEVQLECADYQIDQLETLGCLSSAQREMVKSWR